MPTLRPLTAVWHRLKLHANSLSTLKQFASPLPFALDLLRFSPSSFLRPVLFPDSRLFLLAAVRMPHREILGAIVETAVKELLLPCIVGVIGAICESAKQQAKQPEQQRMQEQVMQPLEPSMQFISDVTIPDRCAVPAGVMLDKRWLVRNDSASVAWPAGSKLVFVRGDRALSDAAELPLQLQPDQLAAPGQQVEVAARLRAPAIQGRYSAIFRLADAEGSYFGVRLYVDLFVRENDESTSKHQR